MTHSGRRVRFLASVTHEREAILCASLGADIIDAKDPAQGALGALGHERVTAIRASLPPYIPVSATVGDPSADIEAVCARAEAMAAAGADFVKVGVSAALAPAATLARVGRARLGNARLIAVLLADDGVDLALLARASAAGFYGVMLDTRAKSRGPLPAVVRGDILAAFVNGAHAHGLIAGLAGSLDAGHVPELAAVGPDVLGFRGGLCRAGDRARPIDADAVREVRRMLDLAQACGPERGSGIAPLEPERAL
jgi:uncharacterized protein (UPF0264 family)